MIATRGEERRRWVQVLTDTPENQENNVIDEIWEEREGELVRLEAPSPGPTQEATLTLGEETLTCSASTAKLQGQPVSFSFLTCPDFLWTHGEGTIGPNEGPPLWRMRVVSDSRH